MQPQNNIFSVFLQTNNLSNVFHQNADSGLHFPYFSNLISWELFLDSKTMQSRTRNLFEFRVLVNLTLSYFYKYHLLYYFVNNEIIW